MYGCRFSVRTYREGRVFAGAQTLLAAFNAVINRQTRRFVVRKLLLTGFLALVFVAPASASPVVPIVMKDPGCHWFMVKGKFAIRYVSHGPVSIRNLDEAALKFVGPKGTKLEKVGATTTFRAKGVYRITMVGQMKHDNTLTLVVK